MEREYIRISKPTKKFPSLINKLRSLDDEFWKSWIFYHLLNFYKNHNQEELKRKIDFEKSKSNPRVEDTIAKFIRQSIKQDEEFSFHFDIKGETVTDTEIEGYYDITIHNTYWKNKNFHFECKNLDESSDLINKYLCYNTYKKDINNQDIFDGGVLRYFNGKYAQDINFGGMIGFVLNGDVSIIKQKIIQKLNTKFPISPEGDLLSVNDNSIDENYFTFDSIHSRKNTGFTIHHLLFDFK